MHHLSSSRNPFRPVHWRWERARQIVEGQLPQSAKRDDIWISRAAKFRRRYAKCLTDLDFACLADAMPDIYWAHDIWMKDIAKDAKDLIVEKTYEEIQANVKYLIEARVLADDTLENIEFNTGIATDTIEAYEQLFFDVRSRLAQKDYILFSVLGPAVARGLRAREYDLLWKLFAYMRGVHTLDYVLNTFDLDRRVVPKGDVNRIMEEDMSSKMLLKSTVVAQTMYINSETQADIIGLWAKLKEIERLKGANSTDRDAINAGLAKFLKITQFEIGPPESKEPTALELYDQGAIEVNSIELSRYATTGQLELDPELQTIPYDNLAGKEDSK